MFKNRTPDPTEAAPQGASPRLFENRTVDPEDSADPEEQEVIAGVASGVPVGIDASRFAIEHHGMLIRVKSGADFLLDRDIVTQVLSKALPPAIPQPGELLTAKEAGGVIGGIARSTFLAYHGSGRVPLPVYLSERCVRWGRHELVAWMRAGCPKRDAWEKQKKTLASKAI